jgi:hypothetical protein
MAELKRNFLGAKMNKDADERLVKPGEYRDALNIEVSTSEGSNVGTVQSIKGNTKEEETTIGGNYGLPVTGAKNVATIADKNSDMVYSFVSSFATGKDYIIEYNVKGYLRYVFVDIFNARTSNASGLATNEQPHINVPVGSSLIANTTGIRIGMSLTSQNGYKTSDKVKVTDIAIENIQVSGTTVITWKVSLSKPLTAANCSGPVHNIPAAAPINFVADRVLNFNSGIDITGINILDRCIYWTDGFHEPKKINIERCIAGTGGTRHLSGGTLNGIEDVNVDQSEEVFNGDTDHFHTRLVNTNAEGGMVVVTKNSKKEAVYSEEKYLTVIKKAPVQPLDLKLYRNKTPRIAVGETVENASSGVVNNLSMYSSGELLNIGDSVSFSFTEPLDLRLDDELLFSDIQGLNSSNQEDLSDWLVKIKITDSGSSSNTPDSLESDYVGEVVSISQDITQDQVDWWVNLDLGESLFEFKFPRFSYRYKYMDGEYSSFAPWSTIGFLPDSFNYVPAQGYNIGMVNQVRSIAIKDYFASETIRSRDISEIDILYKEDGSPTVYNLKTITKTSKHWPDQDGDPDHRGEMVISSDSIYSVLPSNQLLRPYDNVPRSAKAQEISANRLIYGNYLQGFDVKQDPELLVGVESRKSVGISDINKYAALSTKSMREYSVGITYSDKYGRETPVMFEKGSIKLPKSLSSYTNKLTAKISKNSNIPSFAKYFSYYIKETSLEYYNLVMDRWYKADDGNIWLSFPSSERNKVDEDTYIKLKKRNGSSAPSVVDTRYKIISIENEAPDSVKERILKVGSVYNTNSYVGNSEEGYPLQGYSHFTVTQSAFDSQMDFTTFSSSTGRQVKFIGAGKASGYYDINSITLDASKYRVELKQQISTDALFTSTNDTFAGAIPDLELRFFETKTENRPEFDGRFFVKINRDQALQSEVLNSTLPDDELGVSQSWTLRYLNNNGYKNVVNSAIPSNASTIKNESFSASSPLKSLHPTEFLHHTAPTGGSPTGQNQAKYFWGGDTDGSGNSVVGGDGGLSTLQINENPITFLNDRTNGDGDSPRVFWINLSDQKDFFIDGATAHTFTGVSGTTNMMENFFDGEDGDQNYALFDVSENPSVENPAFDPGASPFFNGVRMSGNMVSKNGLPSRGIWHTQSNDGSFMDISWTGMGLGSSINNPSAGSPWPLQLRDVGVQGFNYNQPASFISTLATPGTKFRFQNDPNSQVYTVQPSTVYQDAEHWKDGSNSQTGAFGIRNMRPDIQSDNAFYQHYSGYNVRQRWTIEVKPKIGNTVHGYNPIHGTKGVDEDGPSNTSLDYRRALHHDATDNDVIEILDASGSVESGFVNDSAIWETEPKDTAELDIYYQASGFNPLYLNEDTNEEFIPIGSTFTLTDGQGAPTTHTVTSWSGGQTLNFDPSFQTAQASLATGTTLSFTIRDSYKVTANLNGALSVGSTHASLTLHGERGTSPVNSLASQRHTLDWGNCWSFGNGVESDRIRDDFNAKQLDNGVKASSTVEGGIKEELRKHGLIWSGIYNSTSGINETNQFIMAEKITKDVNPVHGSIQALANRDTSLVMFCEDKVLSAVTNRDALYNADGKPQLVSSNAVVGDVTSYKGDYGISKNPESLAITPLSMYFADVSRGKVLSISNSGGGVVPISDIGMKDYFSTYLASYVQKATGSYDERKNEYNITFTKNFLHSDSENPLDVTTVSFSEIARGWSSFKSFTPENGVCLNNEYYTFKNGHMWKHYSNTVNNMFYDVPPDETSYSSVTLVVNDQPGSVKSFNTINYEGSQARIDEWDTRSTDYLTNDISTSDGVSNVNEVDGEYFNLNAVKGWYADSVTTNLQSCGNVFFKDKEGKYFGHPSGDTTSLLNLDESEFTVQGLGVARITHDSPGDGGGITIPINIT